MSRCAFLLLKDDAPLAKFLHQRLLQEKFAVQMVASGPEAQRYASHQSYDLVVLDLNRHGSVGLDALRSIRLKKPDQSVLMAAGANVVEDRIRAGADDFVAKPFEVAELAARIRAVVRRGNRSGRAVLQVNDLELDRITHGVHRQGREIFDAARGAACVAFRDRGASVEIELRRDD